MSGTTWQHRLDSSHSEAEVLNVAREFLAQFEPVELRSLPEACRPPARLQAADEVSIYAFELVRHECTGALGLADMAHRLARFFSHASTRLAQISACDHVAGADARESA